MARSDTSPRWRRGFFVRLAATGNATLAAKRAGVARTWVYRWRREDAAFAAEWDAALERFARRMKQRALRRRLRERQGAGPGLGSAGGSQAVVAARPVAGRPGAAPTREGPLIARRTRGGRPQLAAARANDWDEAKEAEFFATLGATLNVTAASRAAGFTSKTAWERRRADAAFARRWEAVMEEGTHRLEMRLMELAAREIGALAAEDAGGADALAEGRPLDPELAKWLLKWRAGAPVRARGGRQRGPRPLDLDGLHAEVLRRLEALRQHREPS